MIDWKSKLTSRKFWAAVCAFVTNMILAFHGTQETATQVAALIMAGAAVVAYIIGEGMADAAGAANETPIYLGTADWNPEDFEQKKKEKATSNVG
jgi:hypothetical protein